MTVTNGEFEGKLAQINNAPIAISGGTFTTDPTAYLAEGYMSPKVGDSYKVGLVRMQLLRLVIINIQHCRMLFRRQQREIQLSY